VTEFHSKFLLAQLITQFQYISIIVFNKMVQDFISVMESYQPMKDGQRIKSLSMLTKETCNERK